MIRKTFVAFIMSVLVVHSSGLVQAADPPSDPSSWPVGFEEVLKPVEKGQGSADLPLLERYPPEFKGRFGEAWLAFDREQVFRLEKIKKTLLNEPEKFCPGLTPQTFKDCFSAITTQLTERRLYTTVSHTLMAFISVQYFKKKEASFENRDLLSFHLFETVITSLQAFQARVTPEEMRAKKFSKIALTKSDRRVIEMIHEIDQKVAQSMTEKARQLLHQLKPRWQALGIQIEPHEKRLEELSVKFRGEEKKVSQAQR